MSPEGWLSLLAYAPAILATWALAFLLLVGCGLLVQRLAALEDRGPSVVFSSFWLGLGLALGLLQLTHFLMPVNGWTTLLLGILGASGLILERRRIYVSLARVPRWLYGWTLSAFVLGLWLANRATGPVAPFDAGLYHLSALRWITEYPIVPGLGNLHSRLALNYSYFLYLASIGVGPWTGMASNLGPGLLLWVAGSHSLFHLGKLFGDREADFVDVFFGIFIIPIVRLGFQYGSSPSPDPAVFVFGYALAWALLRLLRAAPAARSSPDHGVLVLLLSSAGIILKPSLAPLAMTAAALALSVWRRNRRLGLLPRQFRRQVLGLGAFAALLLGGWAVRGVLLSGYPFYPAAALRFPVRWAVPGERVVEVAQWVTSWARAPGRNREEVLGNWEWLWPWIHGVASVENRRFDVLYPLALAVVGTGIWLAARPPDGPAPRLPIRFLVPPAIAGLTWFLLAPDPRLAGSSLWWLGAGAISLTSSPGPQSNRWAVRAAGLAIGLALLGTHWSEEKLVDPGPAGGFHPVPQVELSTFRTESGLAVFVPKEGSLCWDAPLPCTPIPDPKLSLLTPGDLGGGFAIDPVAAPSR